MFKIYHRLFPVLLRLAVDAEPVTRSLFAPLGKQLVRWFTKSSGGSPETMVLLRYACMTYFSLYSVNVQCEDVALYVLT